MKSIVNVAINLITPTRPLVGFCPSDTVRRLCVLIVNAILVEDDDRVL